VVPVSLVDDLHEVPVREVPPEIPSVVAGGGVTAAGADGSPSRDRLARIATMIRDAEQAMAVSGDRQWLTPTARLIPLAPRRTRARLRAGTGDAGVDLAS
jgi:hypothetical protein